MLFHDIIQDKAKQAAKATRLVYGLSAQQIFQGGCCIWTLSAGSHNRRLQPRPTPKFGFSPMMATKVLEHYGVIPINQHLLTKQKDSFMTNLVVTAIGEAAKEAAQAFGKELAEGVLDALLYQKKIKEQLELINEKLDWIIGYLVQEFPEIMREALEKDRIEGYEIDIEARWASLADFGSTNEDTLLLKQGIVDISAATRSIAKYLPGTYTQVCFGFLCILAIFKKIAEIDPDKARDILKFADSFEAHLKPALEKEGATSLAATLERLEYELRLANTCIPLLQGIDGVQREFLVSYSLSADDRISFNGASLKRVSESSNNGVMTVTPATSIAGRSIEQLLATDGPHGMAVAPWWPVQQVNPGYEVVHQYNHFTSEFNKYCQIFDKNPKKIEAIKSAISAVEATLKAIASVKLKLSSIPSVSIGAE